MASAAETLKRITLELGGNNAGVVLDDAKPKTVARGIFDGAFEISGQVCPGIKRLYVQELICNETGSTSTLTWLRTYPLAERSTPAWVSSLVKRAN
jgi:acyl-CoA reductase-like NAD-dependent aldehyde dehydrogenase